MGEIKYNTQELIHIIKEDYPNFEENGLLEYTKFVIPNIHFFLSNEKNEEAKKYCTEDLIEKILKNKNEFKISKNIDTIRVGFARLEDYTSENNEIYVKVYTSNFFYDNVSNNINIDSLSNFDKYWNDIWVITFKGHLGKEIINNCPFCGTAMEYDESKYMFTCKDCKDSIYYSKINWKIVDIEVNKI